MTQKPGVFVYFIFVVDVVYEDWGLGLRVTRNLKVEKLPFTRFEFEGWDFYTDTNLKRFLVKNTIVIVKIFLFLYRFCGSQMNRFVFSYLVYIYNFYLYFLRQWHF